MVQQSISRGETNGVKDVSEDYIGVSDEYAMTFDFKEVIHFAVEGVGFSSQDDSQNGNHLGNYLRILMLTALSRFQYRLPYRHRHLWQSDCS